MHDVGFEPTRPKPAGLKSAPLTTRAIMLVDNLATFIGVSISRHVEALSCETYVFLFGFLYVIFVFSLDDSEYLRLKH